MNKVILMKAIIFYLVSVHLLSSIVYAQEPVKRTQVMTPQNNTLAACCYE